MPKRYNNTIYKLFFRNKKTIKAILSSITRIKLIICIEDPEEASCKAISPRYTVGSRQAEYESQRRVNGRGRYSNK